MCWEGATRIPLTFAALAVMALCVAGPLWLVFRARGDRHLLVQTWLAAILGGVVTILVALDGGPAWWLAAVALGAAAGLATGFAAHRRALSLVLIGAFGVGGPYALLIGPVVVFIAATGLCFH